MNDNLVTLPVFTPKNGQQLLEIYKRELDKADYEEILLAIMDIEYFNQADEYAQGLVQAYFEIEGIIDGRDL